MVKDRGADVCQEATQRIVARLGLAGKMVAEVLATACGLDGCDRGQWIAGRKRLVALVGIATIGAPDANVWTRAMPISLMLTTAALSFFWFRVMDVIKPPPARGLQRVPGGAGVLIDDVVVAPYAAIAVVVTLELIVRFGPAGA